MTECALHAHHDRVACRAAILEPEHVHRPGDIGIEIPQNGEPRTRLSMGEHAALTALEWQITREAQDELQVNVGSHVAARSHAMVPADKSCTTPSISMTGLSSGGPSPFTKPGLPANSTAARAPRCSIPTA